MCVPRVKCIFCGNFQKSLMCFVISSAFLAEVVLWRFLVKFFFVLRTDLTVDCLEISQNKFK